VPVDWAGYKSQAEAAARLAADGDAVAAYRQQCRALAKLSAPYNRTRPKEEGFRPKWESAGP
jgi:hypothetical protein